MAQPHIWLNDEGFSLATIQSKLGHERSDTAGLMVHFSGRRQAEDVANRDF